MDKNPSVIPYRDDVGILQPSSPSGLTDHEKLYFGKPFVYYAGLETHLRLHGWEVTIRYEQPMDYDLSQLDGDVEEFCKVMRGYINTPMIFDKFSDHDQRRAQRDLLPLKLAELYRNSNALRINLFAPVLAWPYLVPGGTLSADLETEFETLYSESLGYHGFSTKEKGLFVQEIKSTLHKTLTHILE